MLNPFNLVLDVFFDLSGSQPEDSFGDFDLIGQSLVNIYSDFFFGHDFVEVKDILFMDIVVDVDEKVSGGLEDFVGDHF